MTQPANVGTVSVEVVASAKDLAKSLKREVESAFKDLDLRSAIRQAIGNTKVKLPVEPVVDTTGITAKVRGTRVPKVPVQIDPLLAAFQSEVKRQTTALAKQVNAKIPVGADTSGLRAELGAELAAVQRQLKAQIPTEPGSQAEYELKLRAAVDRASSRVKAHINVDVDKNNGLAALGGLLRGIGRGLPNLGGFASQISDIGGALQRAAGSSAQLGGSLTGAVTSAAGPVGILIGLLTSAAAAMAAIGTAAVLVVPAVSAVAGAAAAIPAALAGAGAAIGTLALGFKGISDAFKPKVKAGGGGGGSGQDAASQARKVAAAERGVESARRGVAAATRGLQSAERGYSDAVAAVADAQKRALQAQQAVNRARVEAREDIDDLNRSLRGAVLSEEDAALGVEEALRALNAAQLTGQIPDIKRADLAYRQSLQTLDEAKDTTEDLKIETTEANAKGVEGSDKVQSALADQSDALKGVEQAQRGVLDAQNAILSAQDGVKSANDAYLSSLDSLAEAQKKVASGGGAAAGAAAQLVKLAPAAQAFVNAIKALKPAFEDLRLDVQQRLFEGLDRTVTRIGDAWIPALKVTLGNFADTFNTFFKNLGSSITTPKFIADVQAGAEGARKGFAAIGTSITTSLVPAFGALSRAAGPFLTVLGEEIASIVTGFSNWVLEGEKTGGLRSFFDRAAEALHDIFTTGKLVTAIIGKIIGAMIGGGATTKTPIDSFNDALAKVSAWLDDPGHQQAIRDFVTDLGSLVVNIGRFVKGVADFAGEVDRVATKIGNVLGGFTADGTRPLGEAMWDGIKAGFTSAFNASVDFVAGLLWKGDGSLVGRIKSGLGISSPSTVMIAVGRDLVAGLINGMAAMFSSLSSRAAGLRTTILNQLANAGSLLVNAGRNVVAGLTNGITSLYGTLSSRVALARTYITNQLSNAGSLLYNAGRAVISGLMSGISSMFGSLGNFLGGVATFIRNNKGPIDKDRKLLIPAGRAIMSGLIGGIDGEKQALAAKLADVSSLVGATTLPGLGADADLALSRSLTAASQQQVMLSMDPRSTGDWLMDGLRRSIQFRSRGNVQAALGSA